MFTPLFYFYSFPRPLFPFPSPSPSAAAADAPKRNARTAIINSSSCSLPLLLRVLVSSSGVPQQLCYILIICRAGEDSKTNFCLSGLTCRLKIEWMGRGGCGKDDDDDGKEYFTSCIMFITICELHSFNISLDVEHATIRPLDRTIAWQQQFLMSTRIIHFL